MQINFPDFSESLAFTLGSIPSLLLAWLLDREVTQRKALGELVQAQSKDLAKLSPKTNVHFGD